MYMRDAKIDLVGGAIATGVLTPPDGLGADYMLDAHEAVSLRQDDFKWRIVPVRARREASGFMVSEPCGPWVRPPIELIYALTRALGFSGASRGPFDYGNVIGDLVPAREKSRLRLTGWTMRLDVVEGGLRAQITARLDQEGATLDQAPLRLDFVVDDATRAAVFGYGPDGADGAPPGVPLVHEATSLDSLCLEAAPVGPHGHLLARSADGGWISLSSYGDGNNVNGAPSASLYIGSASPLRLENGFVTKAGGDAVGRVYLSGFCMRTLAQSLVMQDQVAWTLRGQCLGHVGLHHRAHEEYDPLPDTRITRVELTAALDRSGLILDYRLHVNDLHYNRAPYQAGEIANRATLSWETLILRLPYFVACWKGLEARGRLKAEREEPVTTVTPPVLDASPGLAGRPEVPDRLRKFLPPTMIVLLLAFGAWLIASPL